MLDFANVVMIAEQSKTATCDWYSRLCHFRKWLLRDRYSFVHRNWIHCNSDDLTHVLLHFYETQYFRVLSGFFCLNSHLIPRAESEYRRLKKRFSSNLLMLIQDPKWIILLVFKPSPKHLSFVSDYMPTFDT